MRSRDAVPAGDAGRGAGRFSSSSRAEGQQDMQERSQSSPRQYQRDVAENFSGSKPSPYRLEYLLQETKGCSIPDNNRHAHRRR